MIAIHNSPNFFHPRWIKYCEKKNIPYKLVDCYANDIIEQLNGCNALMWHYHQNNPKDIVMAKSLLFALEQSGMKVFPNFNTAWHFDDKVGQKYLLEALGAELVPTWVFYDKRKALDWVEYADFPKVFKLRGGAGAQNVQLVDNRADARRMVYKAFGKGFSPYNALGSLKERWRKFQQGKTNAMDVLKGIARLFKYPPYSHVMGREVHYVYFQEFIQDNDSDIRIIVINKRAFGIKRMVRPNDFRASGSGFILYEKDDLDESCVHISFELSNKLNAQCVAYDFVFDGKTPKVVEISFGFAAEGYDLCTGYWDEKMKWHKGQINPYGWMVEMMR